MRSVSLFPEVSLSRLLITNKFTYLKVGLASDTDRVILGDVFQSTLFILNAALAGVRAGRRGAL